MLVLRHDVFDEICRHAYGEYPLEMCGLIAGPASPTATAARTGPATSSGSVDVDESTEVLRFYPCRNTAASAALYTIDPKDHLAAEFDADDHDWEIVGVVHSHTHTEPFPSPTDIAHAPDPGWHYVIISLKRDAPELRSYRIVDNAVTEEVVALVPDE